MQQSHKPHAIKLMVRELHGSCICSPSERGTWRVMLPAGGYHELLHGPEKQDAVRFLSDWILSHSGPRQVSLWKRK